MKANNNIRIAKTKENAVMFDIKCNLFMSSSNRNGRMIKCENIVMHTV